MNFHTQQLLAFYTLSTKTICQQTIDELYFTAHAAKEPVLFVFTMVWDVVHIPEDGWTTIFDILNKFSTHKNVKILILFTDWLKDKKEIQKFYQLNNTEIEFVNGIMLTAYLEIYKQKKSETNKQWNHDTGKFLFLTGKWWKANRFPLLKKLDDNNLLQSSIYSLFMPPPSDYCKSISPFDVSHNDLIKYVGYNNNPDNTRTLQHGEKEAYWTHHISAIPYDHSLYAKTSFRLITETCWEDGVDNDPWLTEKTWITIFNRHPFILAGERQSLKKLERLGFKTFEKYMPIPYDNLPDNRRMDAIVENTKYFLENMVRYEKDIRNDVEQNFVRLIELCEQDNTRIKNFIRKYNLSTNTSQLLATTFY